MNRRTIIAAGVAGISAAAITTKAEAAADNPDLEKIKALLAAHDKAMTAHDLDGVLATLTDNVSIMGTGPGEMYTGAKQIKEAYEHFFEEADKGEQEFEYFERVGNLSSEMGWLMTSGNVMGKKGGKKMSFPLNVSLTVSKSGDAWKIAAMHFSTLTGEAEA